MDYMTVSLLELELREAVGEDFKVVKQLALDFIAATQAYFEGSDVKIPEKWAALLGDVLLAAISEPELDMEFIDHVLERGAVIPASVSKMDLQKVVRQGSKALISALLTHGVLKPRSRDDGITCRTSALMSAAGAGRLDLVCMLLDESKFKVDYANIAMQTALRCACSGGHVDVARMLMARYGANPVFCAGQLESFSVEGGVAEGRAACFEMVKAVRSVTRAFRRALEAGDVQEVERLMGQGGWGLVNAVYLEGSLFPLMVAARQGDVAMARLLLAHGARPEVRTGISTTNGDWYMGTALSLAAREGKPEMVTLLLSKEPTAKELLDALMCGCRGGDAGVVNALLLRQSYERKAWVNALLSAARSGCAPVVPLLLERVEDPEERQRVLHTVLERTCGSSPEVLHCLVEPCSTMPLDLLEACWSRVMNRACRLGALDTVRLLMERGLNTAQAATAGLRLVLGLGTRAGPSHMQVARYLLRRGVAPGEFEGGSSEEGLAMLAMVLDTGTGFSVGKALREAARKESDLRVSNIVERGLGFKASDVTAAIFAAAEAGAHYNIMKLQKLGVKPNMEDEQERARAKASMLSACRGRKDSVVLELLEWGCVDVDARSEEGYTPIMFFLQQGNMSMVRRFLEAGADLDTAEWQGDWLPERRAAWFSFRNSCTSETKTEWKDLVKKLRGVIKAAEADDEVTDDLKDLVEPHWRRTMEFGWWNPPNNGPCVVNAKGGEHGWNVLIAASAKGHLNIVEYLLRAKDIRVDVRDRVGKTACMHASEGGHVRVVRLLLEHGARVDLALTSGETALTLAVRKGRTAVACPLLKHGAVDGEVEEEEHGAMRRAVAAACAEGHAEVLDELLEEGGRGTMADLVTAAARGHVEVVGKIMEDPCEHLWHYEWGDRAGTGKDLADWELNEDPESTTLKLMLLPALRTAAALGHIDVLEELLDAAPALFDYEEDDLLSAAIEWGNVDCSQWLLERQALAAPISLNRQMRLVSNTIGAGNLPMLTMLLDELGPEVLGGSDINNPLLVACQTSDPDVCLQVAQLLLDRGAEVNLQSKWFGRPLTSAAAYATAPLVSLLLDRGADMALRDESKADAFETACGRGRVDTLKVFLQHGAAARYRLAEAGEDGDGKLVITKQKLMHGLKAAVRKGDLEVVRGLMDIGGEGLRAAAARWHGEDESPFYCAVEEGHVDVAVLLCDRGSGAKIVREQMDGKGLRHLSRQGKEAELRTMLGLLTCQLFLEPQTLQTPLMAAARAGKLDCVQAWLEHMSTCPKVMALVDQQDVLGRTALWHACEMGHAHVAEVLVAFGADPACKSKSVVDEAAAKRLSLRMAEDHGFLDAARDWNVYRNRDAFAVAALKAKRACIKAMRNVMDAARVVSEAAAREQATITMGEGVVEDRVATVSRLLSAYAAPPLGLDIVNAITSGAPRYTILHAAAKSGDAPFVRMLLGRGAWSNLHPRTISPLLLAIQGGHEEVAQLLLSPETLKARTNRHFPLYVAASCGHLGIVRRILQTAEGRDTIGISGNTYGQLGAPACIALRNGHLDVALELLQTPEGYQAALQESQWLLLAAVSTYSTDCLYIAKRLQAEKLYWLLKYRALRHSHDEGARYLEGRVTAGHALPSVEVPEVITAVPKEGEADRQRRGERGAKRKSVEKRREEEIAVAQHAICHLQAPLYHRLMDLMAPPVMKFGHPSAQVDPLPLEDLWKGSNDHRDDREMYFTGDMEDTRALKHFRHMLQVEDAGCDNDYDRDEVNVRKHDSRHDDWCDGDY